MTEPQDDTIAKYELADMHNAINLLRSQAESGRIDQQFLVRQLTKMERLLDRVEEQVAQNKQASRFEALYNVSRMLGASLDLQVVLDQAMDAIIQLTHAERGFLMLTDDDGGITVEAARNFDRQTLGTDEFKFSRTVTNQVLDTGTSILTMNAAEDPRFADQSSIVSQSLHSVMATPLRARGQVIGVVYVDSRAIEGLFEEDDLAALDTLSAQVAIALDNARLFSATDEALSKHVDELRILRRVDLQLNQALDPDKAIASTLDWACRLSDADNGYLGLLEDNKLRYAYHFGDAAVSDLELLQTKIATVMDERKTVILSPGPGNPEAVLIIPIVREHESIGVVLLRRDDDQPFTAEQQDMVERVVARAAFAIENAHLYAEVQAADKAKSEFVGIVAHDLKAPMTGIQGYADLLLMYGKNLDEDEIEFVRTIIDTVERMEMLVSDLADVSRIESGHFFMTESRVPVNVVIKALKDSTLPQIQARDHQFVDNVKADLPPVWVDYHRLQQVLTNLVSNAYKYTPDGGTITLDVAQKDDRIQFSVTDTGIGLTEEEVANLGTKFWRANNEHTLMQPGTGLGFAITGSLVEQMGSRIKIESTPGEGSRFTFDVAVATETNEPAV